MCVSSELCLLSGQVKKPGAEPEKVQQIVDIAAKPIAKVEKSDSANSSGTAFEPYF